jgi:hypothetical protein
MNVELEQHCRLEIKDLKVIYKSLDHLGRVQLFMLTKILRLNEAHQDSL